MGNCMECIHIDVCINAARAHIDHCNDYSFAGNTVEVVRCRDCKNYVKFESSLIGEVMCCTGQGSVNIQKQPDDFCSCGERKEGDGNG